MELKFSSPETLDKEMDYLERNFKDNYPDWMIKETEKKPATPSINEISITSVSGLSEEFGRNCLHTSVQVIFKGPNSLKLILIYLKIPSQLKQNIINKWACPEENCNLSYTGESSGCLGNRVKNTVQIQHFQQPPQANILYFKIIDQES